MSTNDDDDNEGYVATARVTASAPEVKVESTTARGDSWVTSGKVSFTVQRGAAGLATLQFPFENARGEAHAIQQALVQLNAVLQALSALARGLANQ